MNDEPEDEEEPPVMAHEYARMLLEGPNIPILIFEPDPEREGLGFYRNPENEIGQLVGEHINSKPFDVIKA